MKNVTLFLFLLLTSWISVQAQCPAGQVMVEINIVADQFPSETSWELSTISGTILASGLSTGQNVCVPNNACLKFTIYDSYGDGICCGYGNGSYTVTYNGTVVGTGGQFTYEESVRFGACPPGSDCDFADTVYTGVHVAPNRDYWYVFVPDSTGQYHVHTCSAGCDTKIWMYDYCAGLNWDNTNIGTIYYNDDLCGVRSEIFPNLVAGTPYYIRIGDKNSSCSGSIPWELEYFGPVRGCTDTLACNYEPLAQLPDTCFYPGSPDCPSGPDLTVVQSAIVSSMSMSTLNNSDACAISEGCIAGYGAREIIRFTTHIKNIGDEDYYIGAPSGSSNQFSFDNCHSHWHYEGYAEYLLYDQNNNPLPIGFKNGFCVMDLECSGGGSFQYGCGNMGISSGCGDIYDASLDCQWIDVTNVPAGDYTLVVRVNWDRSPDALGRVERDFSNNWAQVCFTLNRAPGTGAPSIVLNPTCPTITDCMGVPLGTATLDCNGVCNGTAKHGDLDANGVRNIVDAQTYTDEILNGSITAAACTDLNSDGAITVYDAALVNGCGLFGGTHPHNGGGQHDHCKFPGGIVNPNDTAVFTISGIDYVNKHFDISMRNATTEILAMQLTVSGAVISNVTNLVPSSQYAATPEFNAAGEIIMLSYVDSTIDKHTTYSGVLRVYYSSTTASQICISSVEDVVNARYEQIQHKIQAGCVPAIAVNLDDAFLNQEVRVFPNPFDNMTRMEFPVEIHEGVTVRLYDVTGKMVRTYMDVRGRALEIERGTLKSGLYFYDVEGEGFAKGKLMIF